MNRKGLFRGFLILIGIALIALPLVINVENGLWFLVAGFVIFILGFWLWRRKKKKEKMMGIGFGKPGLGDAREMPALTPEREKAIKERMDREKKQVKSANVMQMRALKS